MARGRQASVLLLMLCTAPWVAGGGLRRAPASSSDEGGADGPLRRLPAVAEDPMALYELLRLVESPSFRANEREGEEGDGRRCLVATLASRNCSMELRLPDVSPALAALRRSWQEDGLLFLDNVLRVLRTLCRPPACSSASVDPGCPSFLLDLQLLLEQACDLARPLPAPRGDEVQ